MRKVIKLTAVLLSFMLIILSGCDKCNNSNSGENGDNTIIAETEHYIIKDGKTRYKIVIPDAPRGYENYAAEELAANFLSATNVKLSIVHEKDVSLEKDSAFFIIGETNFAEQSGISADKHTFGSRGFVLKQEDANVFFLGGDTTGTLYAVYEFLHHEFGYEPYALDEIALDTEVSERKLLAFDMKEIPDIPYTQGIGAYFSDDNRLAGHRMRFNTYNEIFVNATLQPWHNSLDWISPEIYNDPEKPETYHPKWFTANQGQLHYTAHGDEEELKALQNLLLEKMKASIEKDFSQGNYYEYIGFMQQDSAKFAENDQPYNTEGKPDSVQTLKEKYGGAYPAAMLIQFINPVAKELKKYMDEKWDGRAMNITIFAYQDTERAPTKVVDGKTVPIDDYVKAEPNVSVLIAPIYANWIVDYEHTGMSGILEEWQIISDKLLLWYYDYYFTNTFIYLDSAYSLQSFYRGAKEHGAVYVFNESPTETYCAPFGEMKIYLTSKLTWDTEQDVDKLIDDFFRNYYKNAYESMFAYYNELRLYIAYLKSYKNLSGVGTFQIDTADFWQEGALIGFMQYINQAFEDIVPLKESDIALYNKLYSRILRESLMPRYLILAHYGEETYGTQKYIEECEKFFEDCRKLGISGLGINGATLEDVSFYR